MLGLNLEINVNQRFQFIYKCYGLPHRLCLIPHSDKTSAQHLYLTEHYLRHNVSKDWQ